MSIEILNADAALSQLTRYLGHDPTSENGLFELLRAEVSGRASAPRGVTLARVALITSSAVGLDPAMIEAACDTLVRVGDFVLAPGAMLSVTPTRLVRLVDNEVLLISSMTTRAAAHLLEVTLTVDGPMRRAAWTDELARRGAEVGAVVLSAEQWAALDRTPNADADYLRRLDERLRWGALGAGSQDAEEPLDWRGLALRDGAFVWRREAPGARLWVARSARRGVHRGWTSGIGPPSSEPWLLLDADEADRARFALAREASHPFCMLTQPQGESEVLMEMPGWLPRAEYRWLSVHGRRVGDSSATPRWLVPSGRRPLVVETLGRRLGLVEKGS